MKKFSLGFVALLLCVSVFFLSACSDQEDNVVSNESSGFTLLDFQKVGKVYNYGDPDIEKNLGKTRETAAVPLLFTKKGTLYSQEEYARDFQSYTSGELKINTYWTDLKTFYTVTKLPYATAEYVGPLGNTPENPGYVLDYLRKEQIPYQQRENKMLEEYQQQLTSSGEKVSATTVSTKFFNGDVLMGKWKNGGSDGHACNVYKQSTLTSATTLNQHINATQTFDAWGGNVPTADQVGIKKMNTYWSNSDVEYRYIVKPKVALSSAEKTIIKSYLDLQDSDTYSWMSTLGDETKWYCSKLVWRSYKAVGRDIGNNPLLAIYPIDIANNSNMTKTAFWWWIG
jgi:uncharacterized protein YycO